MVNCFVDVAPVRDVTVTVTEQRPTRAAIIFVLDTLQSLDDVVATVASTDISLPVVNPAAAAAFVKVIDAPRFTDGEPTILIGIVTVVAVPFLGVIFIFTMHLPGATPVTFEPDVLHTDVNGLDTEPNIFEVCEREISEALISLDNDEVAPVLSEAVFAIGTNAGVGANVVDVGKNVVDVGATVVDVGAVGVPVTAFEVGESPSVFTALIVDVGATVVDVVAVGVPVTAFEVGESPSPFTALIVTE